VPTAIVMQGNQRIQGLTVGARAHQQAMIRAIEVNGIRPEIDSHFRWRRSPTLFATRNRASISARYAWIFSMGGEWFPTQLGHSISVRGAGLIRPEQEILGGGQPYPSRSRTGKMNGRTNDTPLSSSINADRPKKRLAEDRLGYAGFARAIARSIQSFPGQTMAYRRIVSNCTCFRFESPPPEDENQKLQREIDDGCFQQLARGDS
jgi:hypothetical protein